ncbi:hypothetical protein D7241_10040 [Stutzerimonas sp. VN223-3]|uniref:hypothetical protein n=1 Tax=Stutzerimonas sp. VN223-3 TaxID=3384601 RepID=UPI0038B62B16
MKALLASLVMASVTTTALAVPPTHPQPLLGEAHSISTVLDRAAPDRTVSENGFERTPLGEQFAEDGFDLTPQADRIADDGFDRTPLGQMMIAEDGSDRTGLGRT